MEFEKGDHVYVRVSPNKGVSFFGIKGKLAPRYIGPYPFVEECSAVAYRLQLPESLSRVHNVFHVSQLKKCLKPSIDVVISDTEQLEEDLSYHEYPVRIIDQNDRVAHNCSITFYKVQWSNHTKDEATGNKRTSRK